jgi:hypothetical protein
MWTECRNERLLVEKRKSTGEIQANEEMEVSGMMQQREDLQVIEFTTTTDPSLEKSEAS